MIARGQAEKICEHHERDHRNLSDQNVGPGARLLAYKPAHVVQQSRGSATPQTAGAALPFI